MYSARFSFVGIAQTILASHSRMYLTVYVGAGLSVHCGQRHLCGMTYHHHFNALHPMRSRAVLIPRESANRLGVNLWVESRARSGYFAIAPAALAVHSNAS